MDEDRGRAVKWVPRRLRVRAGPPTTASHGAVPRPCSFDASIHDEIAMTDAARTTRLGATLTALGGAAWLGTGRRSATALIPSAIGAPLVVLGALERRPGSAWWARPASTSLAVFGFAGAAPGLAKLPALLRGEAIDRPAAVIARSAMAGLCAAWLVRRALSRA